MNKHAPVSAKEANYLHNQGWSSGFGWEDELDWYWHPSSGQDIWIKDDPEKMAMWLEDRAAYQRYLVAPYMTEDDRFDRIVECVNFCSGVSLPEGVALVEVLAHIESLMKYGEWSMSTKPFDNAADLLAKFSKPGQ